MSSRLSGIQRLESVIDDVVRSYEGGEVINNLESAALPNKRAVVASLNHIKPVIYMGFYSTRGLSPQNLRYAVSEHLYPAAETLAEQIHRAVTYEEGVGRGPVHPDGWAEEVVLKLLGELPRLRRVLNADVLAA